MRHYGDESPLIRPSRAIPHCFKSLYESLEAFVISVRKRRIHGVGIQMKKALGGDVLQRKHRRSDPQPPQIIDGGALDNHIQLRCDLYVWLSGHQRLHESAIDVASNVVEIV
jgi:hypothetical protein